MIPAVLLSIFRRAVDKQILLNQFCVWFAQLGMDFTFSYDT